MGISLCNDFSPCLDVEFLEGGVLERESEAPTGNNTPCGEPLNAYPPIALEEDFILFFLRKRPRSGF